MSINLKIPSVTDLNPRITVFGVGGAGGNAVNNMITSKLEGVEFVVANTDAQALAQSKCERRIQIGAALTEGLGAGSKPAIGAAAAEEAMAEILDHLSGIHMVFIAGGMGGGTGTGAAPVIARAAREMGILTVGVVTKPFQFEGQGRMVTAENGIEELTQHVDTLIVIPNQNLFRVANEKTTFADAFSMADEVLHSGVAGITDLMVKEGLINLDFADVRSVMNEMGKAMMGTGQASGEKRAIEAAEAAISNPLLDDVSMRGARGLLISITGGDDLTLYEVDEAATRIREEVDPEANIILGATFDGNLDGFIRVSVVATGIDLPRAEKAGDYTPGFTSGTASSPVLPVALPPALTDSFDDEKDGSFEMSGEDQPDANNDLAEIKSTSGDDLTIGDIKSDDLEAGEPFMPDQILISDSPSGQPVDVKVAPRMPKIDEFPPMAVKQFKEKEIMESSGDVPSGRKRPGFFEKLVKAGLGKKDPETQPAAPMVSEPRIAQPRTAEIQAKPAPINPLAEQNDTFNKAPAHQPQPVQNAAASVQAVPEPQNEADFDAEQLEIPAFLRRQAN